MIKFSSIIILLFLSLTINAQIFNAESCGNRDPNSLKIKQKPWYGNNQFLYDYLDSISYNSDIRQVMYKIPVKFWVYTNGDGKNKFNEKDLKEIINYLNYYYSLNNTGLRFYQTKKITYIRNKKHYDMGFMVEGPIQTIMHKEPGCINVHLPKNLSRKLLNGSRKRYYGVFNSATMGVITRQKTATGTLSHEIGHYFGLDHPHKHSNRGKMFQESVSRTRKSGIFKNHLNCEKHGDALCDTPAEPNLSYYSDENCRYTGYTKTDNWGDRYRPSVKNLMSYTQNRECRDLFTTGQIAVMLHSAEKNKYGKYWSVKNKNIAQYDFDVFEPDDTKLIASEIFGSTPQDHTFHKIFSSKKYEDQDEVDWLFFDVSPSLFQHQHNKFSYFIDITKGKYHFSRLKISVYNSKKELVRTTISNPKNGKIKLGELKNGRYYIKIVKNDDYEDIAGYKIGLIKK